MNERIQLHLYEYKNGLFSQIAIIDDYQDISFEHNLYYAGQFTISINFNIPNASLFKKGLFVRFGENKYDFGEISRITDNVGENGKGSQIRQIFGYDARYLFKRRVIKNMNDGGKWSMTAKGELCLRNLVKDQCGINAEAKRQLPVINTIPTEENAIGSEYSVSEEFTNLYEVCKTIATQSEFGWRVKFENGLLYLECYEGTDRSATVQFSPEFDSLANGQFSDSTDSFSNSIYVSGKGQNEERDLYEGETAIEGESPTGLERFESYDNQSQMTTEEEYEAEAKSMLTQYGQTIEMSGNGLVKCPYVFREQYDVGDKITLAFNNQKATVQILSLTERWVKGNYTLNFQFGKPENSLSDQLQILLRRLQMASNKTNAVDSVKWYEIPTDTAMSKSDVTFNTIGFTGAIGNSDFTFTLYNDDEQTGSKTYNVYFKNLTGSGKLILTTGKADTDVLEMKSGTYIASVYVDEEGNVKLNSQTVAVNPDGEATETAQTLEVGGTIYNVGGGSGGGIPLGSCIGVENDIAPNEGWLKCDGSTFDAEQYPALAIMLNGNTLPIRFDKTRPDVFEEITLSTNSASPTVMDYDGILLINTPNSNSCDIYVNGKIIHGYDYNSVTIPINKGDTVYTNRLGAYTSYVQYFKHPLFIKAITTSNDKDYQGTIETFREFVLAQKPWHKIYDNPTNTYSANIVLTEDLTKYNEVMFVGSRTTGICKTSTILPVEWVKECTENDAMSVVGYGSAEGIFFKYVDETHLTITTRQNLVMKRIYAR